MLRVDGYDQPMATLCFSVMSWRSSTLTRSVEFCWLEVSFSDDPRELGLFLVCEAFSLSKGLMAKVRPWILLSSFLD